MSNTQKKHAHKSSALFTLEEVRRFKDEAQRTGSGWFLSEEARNFSLKTHIEAAKGGDVWVFAYGSLMWRPTFRSIDQRKAHLRGYHRTFCLTSFISVGTPDRPGLTVAIDRGGSCTGIAYRVAADHVADAFAVMWYREMLTGSYEPRWVTIQIEGLGRVRALTFVLNRDHPAHERALTEEQTAERIAHARGGMGANYGFLFRLMKCLEEMNVVDGPMSQLESRVRAVLAHDAAVTQEPATAK